VGVSLRIEAMTDSSCQTTARADAANGKAVDQA